MDRARLALLLLAYILEHLPQRDILGIGVHGYIGQTGHAVGGKSRHTTVSVVKGFYYQVHFTTRNQLVETWLA